MTDKTDSKEREAFEAWFSSDGKWPKSVERNGDCYKLIQAQQAWDAFQAGRASVHIDLEDMATASAQGFRDGVASLAANTGSEPVATVFTMEALAPGGGVKYHATVHKPLPAGTKLYLHPSPPEGMVGGWMPIETAPKDMRAYLFLCGGVAVEGFIDATGAYCVRQEAGSGWRKMWRKPTHWMPITPPPTSSADSRKGE